MRFASCLVALWLLFLLVPKASVAFEPPDHDNPQTAVDGILTPLMANDRGGFAEAMNYLFDKGGKPVVAAVFDTFLTPGETFEYVDQIQTKNLGETLTRFVYALRSSKNDFLFLRIHVVKGMNGWIVYDMDVNDELNDFFPGWDNP